MLRALFLAACLASASAFSASPMLLSSKRAAKAVSGVTGMNMQQKSASVPFLSRPEKLDGSMPGDVGFDPLGISYFIDLKWLREAELKHGRICMLAAAGILVQEVIHLPGPQFATKYALDAWSTAPRGGMISILISIGLIEAISNRFAITATDMFANPNRKPGDLGFDPLSLGSNPATRPKYELSEVIHGRAAMIGVSGMIHQMIVSKQPVIDQLLNFKPVDASFKLGGAAGNMGMF